MSIPSKEYFIATLVDFLVAQQAAMSVALEMGTTLGDRWARLRGATPLQGYPTVEEATKTLTEFLK